MRFPHQYRLVAVWTGLLVFFAMIGITYSDVECVELARTDGGGAMNDSEGVVHDSSGALRNEL